MPPILAHGVAPTSMSGYSAPPDSLGHEAYGFEHMPYRRSTYGDNRA
ncbi:hypothetical protein ACK389_13980 [Streptomyces antibioticus]|uniref:Uncharacterized protein n=1 Tax=Streptomyces antibioticus TaxID=1890 RepID=A0AAE7CMX4_STRAT|nr:hypothetical protein [Streptomyces antibioticus]QIT47090.1 hypothetical protein HCX60_29185 [Streptomyces antibioticus]